MGKPYSSELKLLASTYAWAMGASVQPLTRAVAHSASTHLLVVGSGGSLSAARYAATLPERYTGEVARAVTPLEVVSAVISIRDPSVMFLSAGGKNPDIIGALSETVGHEPKRLIVVCPQKESPKVPSRN